MLQRCHYPAPYKYCVFRGLGIPANPLSAYTASWLLPICHVRDPALRSFPLSLIFFRGGFPGVNSRVSCTSLIHVHCSRVIHIHNGLRQGN